MAGSSKLSEQYVYSMYCRHGNGQCGSTTLLCTGRAAEASSNSTAAPFLRNLFSDKLSLVTLS